MLNTIFDLYIYIYILLLLLLYIYTYREIWSYVFARTQLNLPAHFNRPWRCFCGSTPGTPTWTDSPHSTMNFCFCSNGCQWIIVHFGLQWGQPAIICAQTRAVIWGGSWFAEHEPRISATCTAQIPGWNPTASAERAAVSAGGVRSLILWFIIAPVRLPWFSGTYSSTTCGHTHVTQKNWVDIDMGLFPIFHAQIAIWWV